MGIKPATFMPRGNSATVIRMSLEPSLIIGLARVSAPTLTDLNPASAPIPAVWGFELRRLGVQMKTDLPAFLTNPTSASTAWQMSQQKQSGCQLLFMALMTRPMMNSPGAETQGQACRKTNIRKTVPCSAKTHHTGGSREQRASGNRVRSISGLRTDKGIQTRKTI